MPSGFVAFAVFRAQQTVAERVFGCALDWKNHCFYQDYHTNGPTYYRFWFIPGTNYLHMSTSLGIRMDSTFTANLTEMPYAS
jgi:hypothetical protein